LKDYLQHFFGGPDSFYAVLRIYTFLLERLTRLSSTFFPEVGGSHGAGRERKSGSGNEVEKESAVEVGKPHGSFTRISFIV